VTAACLEADGLGHAYGGRAVLHDVGLTLGAGELVGLIGPNGAGKSTLVRLLAGITTPQQGEVRLAGEPLRSYGRRALARAIAFVPQDPRIEFPFNVLEVVLMGRAPYLTGLGFATATDVELARAALAQLELDGLESRDLDSLSGGERQRVFLARALVQDPRVLLLDEPTTHLDLRHQATILEVVRRRVRTEGLGAVAVLHDLNLAAIACDRLVLLAAGRIAAAGTAAAVLTSERLAAVFGARVCVERLDGSGRPAVLPLALRDP
jgi:iron complex transport system ATP-binding protein